MRKEGRDDLHLNLCRMNYVLRLFVPSGPVSYGATNLAFLKSDGTKLADNQCVDWRSGGGERHGLMTVSRDRVSGSLGGNSLASLLYHETGLLYPYLYWRGSWSVGEKSPKLEIYF